MVAAKSTQPGFVSSVLSFAEEVSSHAVRSKRQRFRLQIFAENEDKTTIEYLDRQGLREFGKLRLFVKNRKIQIRNAYVSFLHRLAEKPKEVGYKSCLL